MKLDETSQKAVLVFMSGSTWNCFLPQLWQRCRRFVDHHRYEKIYLQCFSLFILIMYKHSREQERFF